MDLFGFSGVVLLQTLSQLLSALGKRVVPRALACEAHTYFRSSLPALLLFFDYCYFYWS